MFMNFENDETSNEENLLLDLLNQNYPNEQFSKNSEIHNSEQSNNEQMENDVEFEKYMRKSLTQKKNNKSFTCLNQKQKKHYLDLSKPFQERYKKGDKSSQLNEIWQAVWEQQFQKLRFQKKKLQSIAKNVQELADELEIQKKNVKKYIRYIQKLNKDLIKKMQLINEKLKLIFQDNEEIKSTKKKQFSFGKEIDGCLAGTFIGSVEQLEIKQAHEEESPLDISYIELIYLIKKKLDGENYDISQGLIDRVASGERMREWLASIQKSLKRRDDLIFGNLDENKQGKSYLKDFIEKVENSMDIFQKKIKESKEKELCLFSIEIASSLTFITLLINQKGIINKKEAGHLAFKFFKFFHLLKLSEIASPTNQFKKYLDTSEFMIYQLIDMV